MNFGVDMRSYRTRNLGATPWGTVPANHQGYRKLDKETVLFIFHWKISK